MKQRSHRQGHFATILSKHRQLVIFGTAFTACTLVLTGNALFTNEANETAATFPVKDKAEITQVPQSSATSLPSQRTLPSTPVYSSNQIVLAPKPNSDQSPTRITEFNSPKTQPSVNSIPFEQAPETSPPADSTPPIASPQNDIPNSTPPAVETTTSTTVVNSQPSVAAEAVNTTPEDPVLTIKVRSADKDGYISRVVINWDDGSAPTIHEFPPENCSDRHDKNIAFTTNHEYKDANSYSVTATATSQNCDSTPNQEAIDLVQVVVGGTTPTSSVPQDSHTTTTTSLN